ACDPPRALFLCTLFIALGMQSLGKTQSYPHDQQDERQPQATETEPDDMRTAAKSVIHLIGRLRSAASTVTEGGTNG
ncbi:MAG: hypothetical protein WB630_18635, partial [Candidatus Acidiferrales bacterium]